MAFVLALYKKPADASAFDRYYFATHVPIAKKLPGLRRYEVSSGPVVSGEGGPTLHMVAALTFDSMAAIQALGLARRPGHCGRPGQFCAGGGGSADV